MASYLAIFNSTTTALYNIMLKEKNKSLISSLMEHTYQIYHHFVHNIIYRHVSKMQLKISISLSLVSCIISCNTYQVLNRACGRT